MCVGGGQVRCWIQQSKAGKITLLDLLPRLARALRWAWVALPSRPTDLDWQAVLFTGLDVARASVRGEGTTVRRTDPLRALTAALRSGREQLLLDPGLPSRLALRPPMMRLLFREYGLLALERRGGAWVLSRDGALQALEIRNRAPQLPLYLTRGDAVPGRGAEAVFRCWGEIVRGCLAAGTDRLLLHAGQPEQIALARRHLARLGGGGGAGAWPLARIEQAMARRHGAIGGAEISRLLARLDRIWAPVLGGEVIPVGADPGVIDLFTSAGHAENYLGAGHSRAAELVQPRLVPARPLFERLIREQIPVVINAGWIHRWQVDHALLEPPESEETDGPAMRAIRAGNGGLGSV